MVLMKTQFPAVSTGFPDVCYTPVSAGVPTPTPYSNISTTSTAVPTAVNILITCMPVHNLTTLGTISNGDEGGVNLGVASGLLMGPDRNLLGSVKTFFRCMPGTRMTDVNGQNGVSPNAVGAGVSPSQVRVLVLT